MTKETPHFRHEKKHYISPGDHAALRRRLGQVMRSDPNAGPDGVYTVHSLYFDDWQDTALREKLDGLPRREKFRIRYYNRDLDYIRLEKKSKIRDLCLKESQRITRQQCQALMEARLEGLASQGGPLLAELCAKMRSRQLRARTCVCYRRDAYWRPEGNVRVTIDYDIGGAGPHAFLEPDRPLLKHPGITLLEVKYDQYLPEYIAGLVELSDRSCSAFSKYACARNYL